MPAPRIAVSIAVRGAWPAWLFIWWQIWWAGGRAVRVSVNKPIQLSQCAGLVLGGGADVSPARYKEEIIKSIEFERKRRRFSLGFLFSILIWLLRRALSLKNSMRTQDHQRDDLEFDLLNHALELDLPTLGICRGAQIINVLKGGSLYQDTHGFYKEQPRLHTILPRKLVEVTPGSRLHSILRRGRVLVNSLHLQSVKHLGHGLKVVAMEKNGVVQAIESNQHRFLLGVQWHPEFLPFQPEQRRIFRELVRAATQRAARMTVEGHVVPVI